MKPRNIIAISIGLLVAVAGLWSLLRDRGAGLRPSDQPPHDNPSAAAGQGHQDGGLAKPPPAGTGEGRSPERPEIAANPTIPKETRAALSRTSSQRPPVRAPTAAAVPVLAPWQAPQGGNADVERHVDKIKLMLRDYRTLMGENPVGTNAEIMKAIIGANPKGARLGPPEGMSLNGSGELVDPWGTAYFFHQLSGTQMEIRSAGQDRKMWTGDDIVLK